MVVNIPEPQAEGIYVLKISKCDTCDETKREAGIPCFKCFGYGWVFELVPLDEALEVGTAEKVGGTD